MHLGRAFTVFAGSIRAISSVSVLEQTGTDRRGPPVIYYFDKGSTVGYDTDTKKIIAVNDCGAIKLTGQQLLLVGRFCESPDNLLTYDALYDAIQYFPPDYDCQDRIWKAKSVRNVLSKIRKNLRKVDVEDEDLDSVFQLVRGIGYRFVPRGQSDSGGGQPSETEHSFDFEKYRLALAKSDCFSTLSYRSLGGGPSLDTRHYVVPQVKRCGSAVSTTQKPTCLLDFDEEGGINLLIAPAGCGKTSLLRALVRSFDSESKLSGALGFPDDWSRDMVPFFLSFSPAAGGSRCTLEEGTLKELIMHLYEGGGCGFPDLEATVRLIKSLGGRALFMIDSLDEASDWGKAKRAICDLRRGCPNAKVIVSCRSMPGRDEFGSSCSSFFLVDLNEKLQKELFKRYIIASHNGLEKRRADEAVSSFFDNPYTKRLARTPLFASIAAKEWTSRGGNLTRLDAGKSFSLLVESLLGKAIDVLREYLHPEIFSLGKEDLESVMGRLAVLFFLAKLRSRDGTPAKTVGAPTASLPEVGEEVSIVNVPPLDEDSFVRLVSTIIADLGLPSQYSNNGSFCRVLAVASGVIGFDPGDKGGTFGFESEDLELFLASRGIADLLMTNQRGCLDLIDWLLDFVREKDVRRLITMSFYSITETGRRKTSIGTCSSPAASIAPDTRVDNRMAAQFLMIIGLALCRIPADGRPADSAALECIKELLKEVRDGVFSASPIISRQFLNSERRLYEDLIDKAIETIDDFLTSEE